MKMTTAKQESIHIDEDFTPVDDRALDSRHRITLSDHVFKALTQRTKKIDSFEILVGKKDGNVLLRPKVSVPADEAWIHENPRILASLRKGMKQIEGGKFTKVKDMQKFLDEL